MLLATFLLCAPVSFLTGTAFGTAATMGTICAFVATSAGVPVIWTGGAVLAGSYFGDRCSPVSTSALLVGMLTQTKVAGNIPTMVRTSLVPFVLTCAVFLLAGKLSGGAADAADAAGQTASTAAAFALGFALTPWELLPAVLVPLLSGGGVVSMVNVILIVLVSSTYARMFEATHMLAGVRGLVEGAGKRCGSFAASLLASVACALVCCNQTLTIMLTHQLAKGCEADGPRLASHLGTPLWWWRRSCSGPSRPPCPWPPWAPQASASSPPATSTSSPSGAW